MELRTSWSAGGHAPGVPLGSTTGTARCSSSHRGWGGEVYNPRVYTHPYAGIHTYTQVHAGIPPPWTDKHMWKHDLLATSFADNKKYVVFVCLTLLFLFLQLVKIIYRKYNNTKNSKTVHLHQQFKHKIITSLPLLTNEHFQVNFLCVKIFEFSLQHVQF